LRAQGEGLVKLMKRKMKGKKCAVFYFAGKRIFLYIYEVITWEKIPKRASIYYLHLVLSCPYGDTIRDRGGC